MPVLSSLRKTKTLILPESKGKVEVYQEFLTGDYRQLMSGESIDPNDPKVTFNKGFEFVLKLISDWDFTNDNEEKLAITPDNLDLLPLNDLTLLISEVNKVVEKTQIKTDIKKNTLKPSI